MSPPLSPDLALSHDAGDFDRFDAQGYLVLPNAVPAGWIAPLCAAFDAGVLPWDRWPVPRGRDWVHAAVDLDPHVQRVCCLPALLSTVRHRLGGPFFLSQVEGREPLAGNALQPLHRDGAGCGGQIMSAMVWLDPYDAANGATQIVAGSHLDDRQGGAPLVLSGAAGDILVFDPEVLHGATTNLSGARRRRSLLLSYAVTTLRASHRQTEALRHVRMDTTKTFGATV
ncbi:phytanoyl-CoA dioxygenase family protein [Sphingomonas sp. SUN039]|uniref:phytanoyl-CoA dioxygenase family protein n=1 Tax=Sphingomonas sp. SUN039 TaxID=2937787 RepID=UPI002164D7B0|nr:phytanoyl-CoA dioxygenase family protein [Sphingomonas sp. SUN039]UVO55442.1 phytanoyl-CoA dioxygenase family protein [Sphingomonas sp. SUN039]